MINTRFQLLIATKAEWETKNPILRLGEPGIEAEYDVSNITNSRFKIGDGINTWNNLPYSNENIYSYTDPATADMGGIKEGTVYEGQATSKIINDLISPYIKPNISTFTSSSQTEFKYEIGKAIPLTLDLRWTLDRPLNVADSTTGELTSDTLNVFSNLGSINLRDLTYDATTTGFTSNTPAEVTLSLGGTDIKGNNIPSKNIKFKWLNNIRWGVRAQDNITTTTHVNNLANSLLTNNVERVYNFPSGYVFILIPEFINTDNIRFFDDDNNLEFGMDLQGNLDTSLPSVITYDNGGTIFDYKIYRGDHFYNSNINIRIE